jgi:uncharacterized protein
MTEPTQPVISLPPASPKPAPNNFFRGPKGIRAGWRVLIFLLIVFGVAALTSFTARFLFHAHRTTSLTTLTPLGLTLTEGSILFCTVIAALIMARIERRRFAQYGLPSNAAFRGNFWNGGFAGFASISLVLLGMFALHGFQLSGLSGHDSTLITAFLAWSLTFIVVGLSEEFLFRGYLQFTLTTGMGFWPSAVFMSAVFGLFHAGNPGETKFGLLSVVGFGLLFCLFLRRTGSLWWGVGFHAGWDWGQTFFYGVPDSGFRPIHNLFNSVLSGPSWLTGGSVGPEASIFTPTVLLIVAIVFSRLHRENHYQQ